MMPIFGVALSADGRCDPRGDAPSNAGQGTTFHPSRPFAALPPPTVHGAKDVVGDARLGLGPLVN